MTEWYVVYTNRGQFVGRCQADSVEAAVARGASILSSQKGVHGGRAKSVRALSEAT